MPFRSPGSFVWPVDTLEQETKHLVLMMHQIARVEAAIVSAEVTLAAVGEEPEPAQALHV